MELRYYLSIVWKWLWLILLSVLIASGSSFLASRAATPLYRTKTTLMIGRATQNPDPNSSELYTGQQLAYTYSQLAVREPVLQGAIESLGLNMSWGALASQVSTNIVPNTQLLEIYVIDSDPYRAKVLADAIAQKLILQGPTGAISASGDDLTFIQEQLNELKEKISTGQDEIESLRQEMDAANSALLIQDLQNQINVLDTKISGWQSTYSQLLNSLQGGNVNTLTVVEIASVPSRPISPNIRMNVLVAAAIGLVLAVGGIFLMEYLDDTIKTPDDLKRITKLPTIGRIALIKGKSYSEKLVYYHRPLDPVVESYRALRTNIQYSSLDNPARSILITSPGPGDGKSLCLANLGVVMAQSGMRVVIVDADFRRPIQEQIFGITDQAGLSNMILDNKSKVSDYLQKTQIANLLLLPAGEVPLNPDILMVAERIKEVLRQLESVADIILVDSPPVLFVADAAILGTQVNSAILVVNSGHTRPFHAARAIEEMQRLHVNLMGVVLNRSNSNQINRYYYYYGKNVKAKGEKISSDSEKFNHSPETSNRMDVNNSPGNYSAEELLEKMKYFPSKPFTSGAAGTWLSRSKRGKKADNDK